MRGTTLGMVVAVLAFAAAGCGGSSTPRLARQDFVSRTNSICRQAWSRELAIFKTNAHKIGGVGDVRTQMVANARALVAHLEAYDPPSGMTAAFDQYKVLLRERSALLEQRGRDIKTIEHQHSHTLGTEAHEIQQREGATTRKAEVLVKRLGLSSCR